MKSFYHPILTLQQYATFSGDYVNHIEEQNGPVVQEYKELTKKIVEAWWDDSALQQLARDYHDQTGLGKNVALVDGIWTVGKLPLPKLKDFIEKEKTARQKTIDFSWLKAQIPQAVSYAEFDNIPLIVNAKRLGLPLYSYFREMADQIISANINTIKGTDAAKVFKGMAFDTNTSSAVITSSLPYAVAAQYQVRYPTTLAQDVLTYQLSLREKNASDAALKYFNVGYRNFDEIGERILIGNISLPIEMAYPGTRSKFNTLIQSKLREKVDQIVAEAIASDIWSITKMSGTQFLNNLTSISNLQNLVQQKLTEKLNNSKQGQIKKYRDRIQWLLDNTEEGRAFASEILRIRQVRESEQFDLLGFIGKIIGPLALIVLPAVGPLLLTSLPIASSVATVVSSVPLISKVADAVTTVKAAIPTEVIDNAKTIYKAGSSVINTVYPAASPTTSSVLTVIEPNKPVTTATISSTILKPIRYHEHPMLTYGLVKRRSV